MDIFLKIWKDFLDIVTPPRAFSWQTFILLSVFSWQMSYFATDWVQNFIASFGWIFLIFGVAWLTTENPIKINDRLSLSPWFTGALMAVFFFRDHRIGTFHLAWISFPIFATIVAAIPTFFTDDLRPIRPKDADIEKIVFLTLANGIISCWISFHFLIQDYLLEYPTVLQDNFQRSAFVNPVETNTLFLPRGVVILNFIESRLLEAINQKPWSEVERWLLEKEQNLQMIKQEFLQQVAPLDEDTWWRLNHQTTSIQNGYELVLKAIWVGPRSQDPMYFVEKRCQIQRRGTVASLGNSLVQSSDISIGEVVCQAVTNLAVYRQ